MTTPDLKKLAEAATQGEWSLSVLEPFYLIRGDEAAYPLAAFAEWDEQGYVRHVFRNAEANSAYIAAAHPQKILELLQEVETLREQLEITHVLVPREPTMGMWDDFCGAHEKPTSFEGFPIAYKAMLAALEDGETKL